MTRYFTLVLCAVVAIGSRAFDVHVEAGGLRAAVPEPSTVTALTVSGSIDASDFAFIADEMTSLSSLDLSGATVSAYEGEAIGGVSSYEAGSIPPLLLAGTRIERVAFPSGLVAIGDCAFAGTALTAVSVPASVRSVGAGAFSGCKALEKATVASATLGDGAFSGCTSLASVELPAGAVIPDRCFSGDCALSGVKGFETSVAVGGRAFEGCTALRTLAFGTRLGSVGARAFSGSGLEQADMSACSGLASVGAGAFSGCKSLSLLLLPAGCDVTDAHALAMGCVRLAEVSVPEGAVPAYAFAGDASIDAGTVIAGATEIGEYAMQGATSTSEMSLPASIEYIGDHAMEGMTGLTRIYATELTAVPELGEDVWSGVDQSSVILIPDDKMTAAFMAADQWKDFDVRGSATTGSVQQEISGRMRACFNGAVLLVECTDPAVESVCVADIDGRVLAVLTPDAYGRAALDTGHWMSRVYLLRADGSAYTARATLKIARNF